MFDTIIFVGIYCHFTDVSNEIIDNVKFTVTQQEIQSTIAQFKFFFKNFFIHKYQYLFLLLLLIKLVIKSDMFANFTSLESKVIEKGINIYAVNYQ